MVLLYDHDHFFQRCIAGTFTQTVYSALNLAGAINYTRDRVGGSQSQVIMTMTGNNRFVDIGYIIYQVCDLFSVLMRQAITRSIGNIDCGGASPDHRFYYTRQEIVVGTAGVFCIKLHIVYKIPGPFYTLNSSFQNFFAGGLEFSFDMKIGCADAGMNTRAPGSFQCVGGHFYIFLHGAAQSADCCVFDCFTDIAYTLEIAG